MDLQIVICDDQQQEREYLRELVLRCCKERKVEILVFSSGSELLEALNDPQFQPSLLMLDIYIHEENGMEVAAQIRKMRKELPITFVTSSREYAIEAFSMRAFHYLVKPVSEEQISRLIELYDEEQKVERPFLTVVQGRDTIKLLQEKICYLQSQNKVTHILTAEEDISVSKPLREVAQALNGQFLKIQRGIVVNMNYISRMSTDSCELKDGQTILLSRSDRSKIRQAYKEFIYNKVMGREEF